MKFLGVIASSPTDIQPVLDVVAENAARLCEANDARFGLSKAMGFGWSLIWLDSDGCAIEELRTD